jgi:hypothetical protein
MTRNSWCDVMGEELDDRFAISETTYDYEQEKLEEEAT